MAAVKEITRDDLLARRREILDHLGLDRDEFSRRIASASLTAEEWDAKDELEGIEFLLGEN